MESALLYTFSTIPQTIAAALGVLAAFVLYRLQSDSETRWTDAQELMTGFGGATQTTLARLLGAQDYEEFIREYEVVIGATPAGVTKQLALDRLKASVDARARIITALKRAFWATGAAILASVVVLMFAHRIQGSTLSSWLALGLGFLALAVCLRLYGLVIWAALGITIQARRR